MTPLERDCALICLGIAIGIFTVWVGVRWVTGRW